jgi:hypothetical protein
MAEGERGLAALVETLRARVERLEARVAELEARPRHQAHARDAGAEEHAIRLPALPDGGMALAGRTLLVLAGAYLVRALADAGVLPALASAGLGLAYAAFWQLRADRDGAVGRRTSAWLHGLASCAIAFPLIGEATARFGWLGARAAGALVVGFAALGLGVALRRRLAANAWITTLAACATALFVLASTREPVPALATLVGLAALVEWLACRDAWLGLRWATAATLDAAALLLVAVAAQPEPPASYAEIPAPLAAAALLALPLLYVASVAFRTLWRGCPVRVFEGLQGSVAAGIGLEGARRVLLAHGGSTLAPALLAIAFGALGYAVAFAHAERRAGQGRNFYFYSTAGGLLMLGGTLELGLGDALPLVWAALGVAATLLGRRYGRTTLRTHGALYLLAAALAVGLVAAGARALAGLGGAAPPAWAWAVAGAAAAAWAVLVGERARAPAQARLPRLLLGLVVALALAEAARQAFDAALSERLAADAGAQAVARTVLIVALALAAARLASRGLPELAWLAWPLAALLGLKLLGQDVRTGRPATLVLSLGLGGALLILLPRLLRARGRS